MAEALINKEFKNIVKAYSSGVKASGKVNPNAKKILMKYDCWNDSYHSKVLDEIIDIDFDLVITVCDNAQENCPMFPKKTKVIHIGFEDPDGKDFEEFERTYFQIKERLLPKIPTHLCFEVSNYP
jgi:arsenate reductase